QMRDHAVWGPALIVTFLYGLLALFGFDKAREETINAMRAAITRLTTGQSETHLDVTAAVDRAHHCWHHVTTPDLIRELAVNLVTLRTRVPGKSGAREDIQRRLASLSEAVSP
ncbi:hypothetical protein ACWC5O_45490, partial [Streptomyces sp. NPDC001450]